MLSDETTTVTTIGEERWCTFTSRLLCLPPVALFSWTIVQRLPVSRHNVEPMHYYLTHYRLNTIVTNDRRITLREEDTYRWKHGTDTIVPAYLSITTIITNSYNYSINNCSRLLEYKHGSTLVYRALHHPHYVSAQLTYNPILHL
jgi:hypothetical protein